MPRPGVVFVGRVPGVRFSPTLRSVAVSALLMAAAADARASAWELFGFGPEGIASVSARASSATDGSAAFYNPGGLAFGRGSSMELSGLGALSLLDAQGLRQQIRDPVGGNAAIDADVPLRGPLEGKLRVGVGVYSPPSHLMRLQLRSATDPFFPYYDNRTQRLTMIPALAVAPAPWLGVGAGANILAGVSGPVDVREGQSRGLETLLDQRVSTVVSWLVGARADVGPWHLSAVFRQQFAVPFHVVTTANVAGVPLMVDVSTASALYDPATVVLGTSLDVTSAVDVEANAAWSRWSAWDGPLLGIDTTVSALSLSSHAPDGLVQDTWSLRGAARWWVSRSANREIRLSAGLGYETSMLDQGAQQGRTNFIDGDKLLVGVGATARFPGFVGRALRLSLGAQLQRIAPTDRAKIPCTSVPCPPDTVVGPDTDRPDEGINNPGYPSLSGSGGVIVMSAGVGVDL